MWWSDDDRHTAHIQTAIERCHQHTAKIFFNFRLSTISHYPQSSIQKKCQNRSGKLLRLNRLTLCSLGKSYFSFIYQSDIMMTVMIPASLVRGVFCSISQELSISHLYRQHAEVQKKIQPACVSLVLVVCDYLHILT